MPYNQLTWNMIEKSTRKWFDKHGYHFSFRTLNKPIIPLNHHKMLQKSRNNVEIVFVFYLDFLDKLTRSDLSSATTVKKLLKYRSLYQSPCRYIPAQNILFLKNSSSFKSLFSGCCILQIKHLCVSVRRQSWRLCACHFFPAPCMVFSVIAASIFSNWWYENTNYGL